MAPRLMQGSDAVADAAIVAGCRFFTGYPMLPFTELLENMAKKLPAAGGVCINAESEIEAINMALGAAATGARAATGSCGQGVYIDVIPRHVPIDFVGRGKFGYPGFRPALESWGNRFSWIGSGSWGERLKNVEGAPVTDSPGGKGKDRDQPA